MNDPHVSALVYRLKHVASVNYDKAVPLEYETAEFKVTIKNLEARFEMKGTSRRQKRRGRSWNLSSVSGNLRQT